MTTIKKVFWISLVLKLILTAVLPLTNDEAYYWVWSQKMQLSFYDHPPVVAWLFWLGEWVRRLTGVPGTVRWPAVLLGQGTLALWILILQPFLTIPQILYWLLLALLSPLVGGSAILVTPDLPLMFFYALSLLCFIKWKSRPQMSMAWALGLSLGLGMSSKYMIVLFGVSLLPFVLLDSNLRKVFFRHSLWIVLGGVIGASPVLLWNFSNDFASWRFQAQHGFGAKAWKPSWTYEYILVQVGLIFPVILYWAYQSRRRLPGIFHGLAWLPLAFFLCTTYRGYVEGNWPIVAYPALLALAVSFYPLNARSLWATLVFWGTAIVSFAAIVLIQPDFAKKSKLREFHQYDGVFADVREKAPLFARSYQMAARLHFELGHPVYKLKGMNRTDFYDFLSESEPGPHLQYFVLVEKGDHLPDFYVQRGDRLIQATPVGEKFELWQVQSP